MTSSSTSRSTQATLHKMYLFYVLFMLSFCCDPHLQSVRRLGLFVRSLCCHCMLHLWYTSRGVPCRFRWMLQSGFEPRSHGILERGDCGFYCHELRCEETPACLQVSLAHCHSQICWEQDIAGAFATAIIGCTVQFAGVAC